MFSVLFFSCFFSAIMQLSFYAESRRSGADQATIEALNNGGTKAVTKLQGLKARV